MNDLEKFFRQNNENIIVKWLHYFDIYDRHFARFRNKEIVILEIGVYQGGSLRMWRDYFGPKAKIYGVDINPRCKELEAENIEIFIGSQSDRKFLRELKKKIPHIDILIDDGGHTMRQQIVTFEEMFSHVKNNGIYLCEDLHTSYWLDFGGGYKRRGTFIEYSKRFIDKLNAYHSEQGGLKPDEFTKNVDSIHYYDSIMVIEKKQRGPSHYEGMGHFVFHDPENRDSSSTKLRKKFKKAFKKNTNKILRFFRLPGIE